MTNKQTEILRLENVHKSFYIESQEIHALRGISLTIPKGSVIAVKGRSGSGKSTLLHLIGMLDSPSRGRILLNGKPASSLKDKKASEIRNQTIGFVFQMNNLLAEFSALENVMMPALIAGKEKRGVRKRSLELLDSVGLLKRHAHRPGELSGGEQQRVAIARALIMSPSILLADEPTGNLDKMTSYVIQDLLLQLCERHNITMLLVTHDMELANRLPKQIVLEDGKIV